MVVGGIGENNWIVNKRKYLNVTLLTQRLPIVSLEYIFTNYCLANSFGNLLSGNFDTISK